MQTHDVRVGDVQRSRLGMWSTTLHAAPLTVLAAVVDPGVPHVVLEDVGTREPRWDPAAVPGGHPALGARTRNLRYDLLVTPGDLVGLTEWLGTHAGALFLWQSRQPPPPEQSLRRVTGHQRLRLARQLGIELFVELPRRSAPMLMSSPSKEALISAVRRLGAPTRARQEGRPVIPRQSGATTGGQATEVEDDHQD
ncbi:hypothetical protein [Nocardioides sp.]|uniref:hypothetical protein n=1 Tax=Nocardioides sp. TaxID=35761 RepID=UPI003D0E9FBB